jgi:hypothetical protein
VCSDVEGIFSLVGLRFLFFSSSRAPTNENKSRVCYIAAGVRESKRGVEDKNSRQLSTCVVE